MSSRNYQSFLKSVLLLVTFRSYDPFFNKSLEITWEIKMPFVVTEACIKCKYTDCVEVCPVDCFHEGPNMLVIDPDECIDCTLCEPECPVEAIMAEDDVPENLQQFIGLNAELSKEWPVINEMKAPPEDADEWKEVKDKLKYLER